jgi:glycosyltransferase involved in cell wall biosynthesis
MQVVMVAQRPPPTHGQAVANATLMDADYADLVVHPVEMGFSKELDEVSRFRPGKLIELLRVAFEISRLRLRGHRDVLFYSVGLRNRTGLYRDMVLLLLARPFFDRTVLHVHTGGTGALIEGLPKVLRPLARRAYGDADTVIYLDPFLLEGDTGMPVPRRHVFVPYGVEPQRVGSTKRAERPIEILFVGNLYESKGTLEMVEAADNLRERGICFRLTMAGGRPDEATGRRLDQAIDHAGITQQTELPGVVGVEEKAALYTRSDIFCFPTHYEAEGMPLVILEAMSAGLPIVSTRWRSIPNVVTDGCDGFLVEPGDTNALAAHLERLATDEPHRQAMGSAARDTFDRRFSPERFVAEVERAVLEAVS